MRYKSNTNNNTGKNKRVGDEAPCRPSPVPASAHTWGAVHCRAECNEQSATDEGLNPKPMQRVLSCQVAVLELSR